MPPITGPTMLEDVKMSANQTWKRTRSRGTTSSPISACDSVISPPPPRPCSTRAATSCTNDCAQPQAAEPSVKMPSATSSMSRRPRRSPSRPYTGTTVAEASR